MVAKGTQAVVVSVTKDDHKYRETSKAHPGACGDQDADRLEKRLGTNSLLFKVE